MQDVKNIKDNMAQPLQEEKRGKGRPVGTVGTKISKLKRIANKLEAMARTQSLDIIQDSLDGKLVDKEKLATAKWTVSVAKDYHNACLKEEEGKRELIEEARGGDIPEDLPSVEEDDIDGPKKFTLKMVETK